MDNMSFGADSKYIWTAHSRIKMRQYGLSESRIKRIIRHPARVEEGILEGAVAAMQPAGSKKYSEVWVLYVPVKLKIENLKLKIISVWRYPGRAPEREPVPHNILREIRKLL